MSYMSDWIVALLNSVVEAISSVLSPLICIFIYQRLGVWAAVLILVQDSFEKVNRGSVGPLWGCVLQAVRLDSLGHSLLSEMEEKRGGRLAGCQMISLIRSLNSSSDRPASPQHYWQPVRPSHPSGNIRQSSRQDPGLLRPPRAVHVCPSAVRVCPAPTGERWEKESRAEDPGRQTLEWTREVQGWMWSGPTDLPNLSQLGQHWDV